MANEGREGKNVPEREGSRKKDLSSSIMRVFMSLCEGWRDAGAGETGRVG